MSNWMGAWMFFVSLGFVALLILSGVLVWVLGKREAGRADSSSPAREAHDILARRNVRDEVDHHPEERRQAPESRRPGGS